MDLAAITDYLAQYGTIAVFVIVFLEYLNLPGFPGGVIMPAAGLMAAQGGLNLPLVLALSVVAGVFGSWVLYFASRLGGTVFLNWFRRKFPKQTPILDSTIERIQSKGKIGLFTARLIPVIRTLISIPAGALQMNFAEYTLYSALGIAIWNTVLICAGFFLREAVFQILKI